VVEKRSENKQIHSVYHSIVTPFLFMTGPRKKKRKDKREWKKKKDEGL